MTMLAARRMPPPARSAASPAPKDVPEPNGFGFALFLVVNAVLFVRPADAIPSLVGIEFYQYAILLCFFVSLPAVLGYLQPTKLEGRPIDLCVIGLLFAVILSQMASARLDRMLDEGIAFLKIIVYYLLFVSLVTTPRRLRMFCTCLVLFACAVTVLSALDFHKVIKLPRAKSVWGTYALEDAERMYGPGIFQDPNDVCMLIVAATMLLLGRLLDSRAGILRVLWLLPLAVFAYGFYLTRSRGGMMALMAGFCTLAFLRGGWRAAFLLVVLAAPVGLAAVSGREVDLSSHQGSGQSRIQLWNEALVATRANPLFGVGANEFYKTAGHVAHNSYMQAFAELGGFGGTLFLGAVILSAAGLLTLRSPVVQQGRILPRRILDPVMDQQYPYVTAGIAAFAAGMITLTLNYLVVTYAFFGMASMILATVRTSPERPAPRFDASLWVKLSGASLAFLAGMFVFIRIFFRA